MSLETDFRDLCTRDVPRWRGAPQWTIREGPRGEWQCGTELRRSSEQGYCDPATKTIWVHVSWRDLHATIIHETCHAVAGGYHGARWQRRMRQAQAAVCGEQELAEHLAADLRLLALPGLYLSAAATYGRVHDRLLDVPGATFEGVVDAIASDYGMIPDEVLRRYRRLAFWYAYYRQEEAEDARIRLQYADTTGMQDTQRRYWQARLDALTS
jgi:hypothetical protein